MTHDSELMFKVYDDAMSAAPDWSDRVGKLHGKKSQSIVSCAGANASHLHRVGALDFLVAQMLAD